MALKKMKALITGGSRGLGKLTAEYLIRNGYEIYVIDRNKPEQLDPTYISSLAGYIECDLSQTDSLAAACLKLTEQTDQIDILVNNATVKQFKNLEDFTPDEISNNITVDFIAPVILANMFLPVMKKSGFGRIINISSISAYKVYATGSLYCSSKLALIAFTEALAKELQDLNGSITVNTICPDAFTRVDGTELENYQAITKSVLTNISHFINSGTNGKVVNVFTFRHKMRERIHFIKRAFLMS